MATTAQHNHIIQVVFDGNKHLNKVLSSEDIKNMTVIENRFPLTKLPVCGACESLAMWDRDIITGAVIATCTKCGAHTKRPVTYASYLAAGYDIDATGATARKVLNYRRENQTIVLPEYEMRGVK